MLKVFCSPSRYVQGENATQQLAIEMQNLGLDAPILILASPTANKLLSYVWQKTFTKENMPYKVCVFGGECSQQEINRIKLETKKFGASTLVGVGGGKVLDTIRAVAADLELPVVNCPTVASSDAPCSALSVVYTEEGHFDRYLFYKKNPDLVLLDSSVIARSPARLLVAGMGDALATLFEADTCVKNKAPNSRGGLQTQTSFALAKLCYQTLLKDGLQAKQALLSAKVTPALENIIEANTLLSGLGFESCGLAAAHAVNNGLTILSETKPYYHGEKVAFGTLVQLVMEDKSKSLMQEVLRFSQSVCLPITLHQLGIDAIDKAQLKLVAERATQEGETIHNEPFKVHVDDVVDAIIRAHELGVKFSAAQ